jgi:diaminohydroxyphosphoribosylaminopyrimidine deaminase / 5-amino-6-(5-phosphoribosylamino)uracil reductase
MSAIATGELRHLQRALELAEGGRGRVAPNPLVGAVLVRDGEVIGEGFHAAVGGAHAELAALADCRERGRDPAGATMYVTLEPCAHQGRTPPCTDAIVAAGIARVVIGADDPSEKASGRGPGILRDEGIEVEFASGPEAAAARIQNQAFRKHARSGRPLVTFKAAMTLDGKVASPSGDSKWISGEGSRALVHRWRAESDAIAVGIGTALADDPLLTARFEGAEHQPRRIVFDSNAALPLNSNLVATVGEVPLTVIAAAEAPNDRVAALRDAGVTVLRVPPRDVRVGLDQLGAEDVTSLMLEGGPRLAGAFLEAGEVDELRLFIAPRLMGAGRALFEGSGADTVAEAVEALAMESEQVGGDLLVRARLREW